MVERILMLYSYPSRRQRMRSFFYNSRLSEATRVGALYPMTHRPLMEENTKRWSSAELNAVPMLSVIRGFKQAGQMIAAGVTGFSGVGQVRIETWLQPILIWVAAATCASLKFRLPPAP